jgi:hypothetical protein
MKLELLFDLKELFEENPIYKKVWTNFRFSVEYRRDPARLWLGPRRTKYVGYPHYKDVVAAAIAQMLNDLIGPQIHPRKRKERYFDYDTILLDDLIVVFNSFEGCKIEVLYEGFKLKVFEITIPEDKYE